MLDLLIFFLLAVGVSYGLFIKRRQMMVIMLSAYVSFFWVDYVLRKFLQGKKLMAFGSSELFYIFAFLGLALIMAIWGSYDGIFKNGKGFVKLFLDALFGLSGVVLLVLLAIGLLTANLRNKYLVDSDLLSALYSQRQVWLSLPIVLMLITGFRNRRK